MGFEVRDIETVYKGYVTVMTASLVGPDGTEARREIEHHGRAVGVLPYDPERRMALVVRLPRAPVIWAGGPDRLMEAPAGMIDDAESAEHAVRREALEEAGVRLSALEPVGAPFSSPGFSAERIALFLASYSAPDRVATGGGVDGEQENITVEEIGLGELWRQAEAGEILDLKTLTLILALKVRRPALFDA
jgi:nudix-type nucleoside diphosphatase (YffH/AdpP family)